MYTCGHTPSLLVSMIIAHQHAAEEYSTEAESMQQWKTCIVAMRTLPDD